MKFSSCIKKYYFFCICVPISVLIGCNGSTSQKTTDVENSYTTEQSTIDEAPKVIPYNIMARIDATGDLRQLYKALKGTDLASSFEKSKESFTLFGSSNKAIRKLKRAKDSIDVEQLVKNQMVAGKITTVSLTKKIRQNGGSYMMKTVGGKDLIAFRKGTDIFVKNSLGEEAEIGKSDITATNGMIHVIDAVLYP